MTDDTDTAGASARLDRRTLLATGLIGAGAAAAGLSPRAVQAQTAAANLAYDPATFTGPGLEAETGGAIYHLPRDHAMHGGAWYRGAEYQETNYFTGFFTDKTTGKPYSVFFSWATYGWDAKLGRPVWVALFSMTDIEGKRFFQCVNPMGGELTSKGSGAEAAPGDFFAEYTLAPGADGAEGVFSYSADGEAWRWIANVPSPTTNLPNQTAYSMDLRGNVMKPGYQCPVPYGFTQEGVGTVVSDNIANGRLLFG